MPTPEEIKAAEDAAAKAEAEAKEKEAAELAATGITTDAGKEALRKEREAKRAAEKAAKQAADELAALKAEKAEADAAKAKAEEAERLKRGEHEQVIAAKTAEVDTLSATAKDLAAKVKTYEDRDRARIETGLKEKQINDAFLPFDPGPDAPLDQRMTWFEKALAQSGSTTNAPLFQRTPNTPRPVERSRDQVLEDEKMRERARHGLRPRPRASS